MEDKGPAIIAVAAVFLGLSFIVVTLRCIVRVGIRGFGIDDALAVASLVRPCLRDGRRCRKKM
jgi:hypothetical protein